MATQRVSRLHQRLLRVVMEEHHRTRGGTSGVSHLLHMVFLTYLYGS